MFGNSLQVKKTPDPIFQTEINLCLAVAIHKFVIAFSLGMELRSSKTPLAVFILYMATFSGMTCVGIGIGAGVSQGQTETVAFNIIVASLQGKE